MGPQTRSFIEASVPLDPYRAAMPADAGIQASPRARRTVMIAADPFECETADRVFSTISSRFEGVHKNNYLYQLLATYRPVVISIM